SSPTGATTASGTSTNCYIGNNTILGSPANGFYYGITLTAGADSNIIEGNKVTNGYIYQIYITAAKHNLIKNNEISRPAKTSVTTFYGIYTTGAIEGTRIEGNRIHTPGGTVAAATGSAYGGYMFGSGTVANPVIVANNIYYNVNQGGIIYGFYMSGTQHT